MLGKRQGYLGDPVQEGRRHPPALRFQGGRRIEDDGLPVGHDLQPGRQIQGHEGEGLPRLLMVHAPQVHEPILKGVDDVVVLVVALGEDHQPVPVPELLHRLPKGGQGPGVVVDADGVGVVEQAQGQGHDQMAQQLIEPADGPGLPGPKVPKGVGRHLLPVHHLPGAPDPVPAGGIQLPGHGPVHLAVVPHDDAGALRQILRPFYPPLGEGQPNEVPQHPIGERGGLVAHLRSFQRRCAHCTPTPA